MNFRRWVLGSTKAAHERRRITHNKHMYSDEAYITGGEGGFVMCEVKPINYRPAGLTTDASRWAFLIAYGIPELEELPKENQYDAFVSEVADRVLAGDLKYQQYIYSDVEWHGSMRGCDE